MKSNNRWMPTPAAFDKAEIEQVILEQQPKPDSYWIYQNAQGLVSHIVLRFDHTNGDKTYSPLTWGYLDGVSGWYRRGPKKPIPLYRLPELLNSKDRPVLIVEGEKTADAAQKIFPGYAVTTTSGGAQNAKNTDYSHLKNREVYIWPDNDKAGFNYAEQIAAILKSIGVRSIHQVSIPDHFPSKWDLADPLPTGIDFVYITAMLANVIPIPLTESRCELETICLADIEPEDVDFLWFPYVARGNLTILDGDPGLGKSHLTLAIASALSNGYRDIVKCCV
jgi:hypothetical protein